jgi:hypothetical protein
MSNILNSAMALLHMLLEAGWEYPDAAAKAATTFDVGVAWIHLAYDKECCRV